MQSADQHPDWALGVRGARTVWRGKLEKSLAQDGTSPA